MVVLVVGVLFGVESSCTSVGKSCHLLSPVLNSNPINSLSINENRAVSTHVSHNFHLFILAYLP